MKKIATGLLALLILSSTSTFAIGGKKKSKSKKAQTCCTQKCSDKKDCPKTATCNKSYCH